MAKVPRAMRQISEEEKSRTNWGLETNPRLLATTRAEEWPYGWKRVLLPVPFHEGLSEHWHADSGLPQYLWQALEAHEIEWLVMDVLKVDGRPGAWSSYEVQRLTKDWYGGTMHQKTLGPFALILMVSVDQSYPPGDEQAQKAAEACLKVLKDHGIENIAVELLATSFISNTNAPKVPPTKISLYPESVKGRPGSLKAHHDEAIRCARHDYGIMKDEHLCVVGEQAQRQAWSNNACWHSLRTGSYDTLIDFNRPVGKEYQAIMVPIPFHEDAVGDNRYIVFRENTQPNTLQPRLQFGYRNGYKSLIRKRSPDRRHSQYEWQFCILGAYEASSFASPEHCGDWLWRIHHKRVGIISGGTGNNETFDKVYVSEAPWEALPVEKGQ